MSEADSSTPQTDPIFDPPIDLDTGSGTLKFRTLNEIADWTERERRSWELLGKAPNGDFFANARSAVWSPLEELRKAITQVRTAIQSDPSAAIENVVRPITKAVARLGENTAPQNRRK